MYYSRKGELLERAPCSNYGGQHSKGVCKVANFGDLDAARLEEMVGADDFGNYIYVDEKKARKQFLEKGSVSR